MARTGSLAAEWIAELRTGRPGHRHIIQCRHLQGSGKNLPIPIRRPPPTQVGAKTKSG